MVQTEITPASPPTTKNGASSSAPPAAGTSKRSKGWLTAVLKVSVYLLIVLVAVGMYTIPQDQWIAVLKVYLNEANTQSSSPEATNNGDSIVLEFERTLDPRSSHSSYGAGWMTPDIYSMWSSVAQNTSHNLTDLNASLARLAASIAANSEHAPGHMQGHGHGGGVGKEGETSHPGDLTASEAKLGIDFGERGLRPKHPIVIVPGFIASGLDLWGGQSCAKKRLRQRLWGTLNMMPAVLSDISCWFKHMGLDPVTGLDPEDIKLRPAHGLECIEYPIQGFWLFARLIEALVDMGYDPNNLVSATYDWRLATPLLEVRDGFFSNLRSTIENLHALHSEKVVVIGHSYGELLYRSFMHWVDAASPGWIEQHVHAVVNIGGPTLGLPKVMTALISGELRETAQLGGIAGFIFNSMMPRDARAKLFRSWGSMLSMMPIGGSKVWGNATWAPDDTPEIRARGHSLGAQVIVTEAASTTKAAAAAPTTEAATAAVATAAATEAATAAAATAATSEAATAAAATAATTEAATAAAATASATEATAASASAAASAATEAASAAARAASAATEAATAATAAARATSSSSTEPHGPEDSSGQRVMPCDSPGHETCASSALEADEVAEAMEAAAEEASEESGMAADSKDDPHAQQEHRYSMDESIDHVILESGGRNMRSQYERWKAVDAIPLENHKCGPKGTGSGAERCPLQVLIPNPVKVPLPKAPSLSMYCLYGVGIKTERSYHYIVDPPAEDSEDLGEADASSSSSGSSADSGEGNLRWRLNTSAHNLELDLDHGIQLTDGDGIVPLNSLGLMCRKGWLSKRLNPSGIRVVTREKVHVAKPLLEDLRGGPSTGQHIDILGNIAVILDVLTIAAGRGTELEDVIHSDIDLIAANVDFETDE